METRRWLRLRSRGTRSSKTWRESKFKVLTNVKDQYSRRLTSSLSCNGNISTSLALCGNLNIENFPKTVWMSWQFDIGRWSFEWLHCSAAYCIQRFQINTSPEFILQLIIIELDFHFSAYLNDVGSDFVSLINDGQTDLKTKVCLDTAQLRRRFIWKSYGNV